MNLPRNLRYFIKSLPLDHLRVSRWSRKQKIVTAAAAVVFLLLTGGLFAWRAWGPVTPPGPDASDEDVAAFLTSSAFNRMDPQQRSDFMDQTRQRGRSLMEAMSDDQRREFFQNMRPAMEERMNQEMDQYFELAEDQRVAYLDQVIDRMGQMRNQRPAGMASRPRGEGQGRLQRQAGPRGPGRGFTPDRFKSRIENSSPEQRAKRALFREAMQKRMQERGIPAPPRRN